MTQNENLLVIAFEESVEVAKTITKAMRFGFDNHEPGREETNEDDFWKEYTHLQATVGLLIQKGIISVPTEETLTKIKNDKIIKILECNAESVRNGCLEPEQMTEL